MTGKTAARKIAFDRLTFGPRFAYGEMAGITEVVGGGDGTALGTGFARFRDADIPWTVKYDEVILVLEGAVEIDTPEGTISAGPRDCIWLPDGTELRYRARHALVFYAITPVNWAERAS